LPPKVAVSGALCAYSIRGYRIIRNIGFPDLTTVAGLDHRDSFVWVDTEHYRIVGACLAAARRKAKFTQQNLLRKLSKPQSFVSEYERGKRRIDVIEFLKITRTIGVNPIGILDLIQHQL
jgi:hypothetical protein